ncbi:MAG: hypothetical protein WA162_00490 [Thermodesulfobacteriota bacterium]
MKFIVTGRLNDRLLQIILLFTLSYISFLWVTDVLIYVERMGFDYASVVKASLGSVTEFKNPVSYIELLEITHMHLFSLAIALLLLNHLVAFLRIPGYVKLSLILVSFISGLLNIGSGWLIRFVSPGFAYLKIGSFIVFQTSFLLLIILSFFAIGVYAKYSGGNTGK